VDVPAYTGLCVRMDGGTESCMRMVDIWMDARLTNKQDGF